MPGDRAQVASAPPPPVWGGRVRLSFLPRPGRPPGTESRPPHAQAHSGRRRAGAPPPLARVGPGSIEAPRKYSQAIRAGQANKQARALALLEEATALDTAFAMAYRKQAIILGNTFAEQSKVNAASSKAYEHRGGLADVWRYLATANYYSSGEYDVGRVSDAYRAVLGIDSTERTSLNNLALRLSGLREWEEAEALARRGQEFHDINQLYGQLVLAQVGQGKYADAAATVERHAQRRPDGDPIVLRNQGQLGAAMEDYEGANEAFSAILETQRSLTWRATGTRALAGIAEIQGQLGAAGRHPRQSMDVQQQRGVLTNFLARAALPAPLAARPRRRAGAGRPGRPPDSRIACSTAVTLVSWIICRRRN